MQFRNSWKVSKELALLQEVEANGDDLLSQQYIVKNQLQHMRTLAEPFISRTSVARIYLGGGKQCGHRLRVTIRGRSDWDTTRASANGFDTSMVVAHGDHASALLLRRRVGINSKYGSTSQQAVLHLASKAALLTFCVKDAIGRDFLISTMSCSCSYFC